MHFCILKNTGCKTVMMHHWRRKPDRKVVAVVHSLINMLGDEKEDGPHKRNLKDEDVWAKSKNGEAVHILVTGRREKYSSFWKNKDWFDGKVWQVMQGKKIREKKTLQTPRGHADLSACPMSFNILHFSRFDTALSVQRADQLLLHFSRWECHT